MVRTETIRTSLLKNWISEIDLFSVSQLFEAEKLNGVVSGLVMLNNGNYYDAWGLNQCPTQLNTN